MSQPRERIPVGSNYINALGGATYNFAYLEWGIICLHETIHRGFLIKSKNLTAGQIAKSFLQAVERLAPSDHDKAALEDLATSFDELVVDRNRLMHGNPFTASGGEQRLAYDGKHGRKDWTPALIDEFSDELAKNSIEAGRILHGGRYAAWKREVSN